MSEAKIEELIGVLAEARTNYDSARERWAANSDAVRDTKAVYEKAKDALVEYICWNVA